MQPASMPESMPEITCDLAVIGGGMAGLPIANKAAYKGLKIVLFERELLGGTCLNRGCIPTKTMIEAARVAHTVRTASRFGITAGPLALYRHASLRIAVALPARAQLVYDDPVFEWQDNRDPDAFSASVVLHWDTMKVSFKVEEP